MSIQKNIVVTGAVGALGRVIATRLAEAGHAVILADVALEAVRRLADDIVEAGGSARFVGLDLASAQSVCDFARNVAEREGAVHGVVNNAAIATGVGGMRFEDIEVELWDRVMAVNVRGPWLLLRALSPLLVDGRTRIVNVASDTALWGAPKLLSYVASKGAVIAMTRSLAREFGARKIGVTAVAPGILRTASTDYVPEERHRLYEDNRAVCGPQGPEDVVAAIEFLLEDGALAATGQTVPVNAGFCFT